MDKPKTTELIKENAGETPWDHDLEKDVLNRTKMYKL